MCCDRAAVKGLWDSVMMVDSCHRMICTCFTRCPPHQLQPCWGERSLGSKWHPFFVTCQGPWIVTCQGLLQGAGPPSRPHAAAHARAVRRTLHPLSCTHCSYPPLALPTTGILGDASVTLPPRCRRYWAWKYRTRARKKDRSANPADVVTVRFVTVNYFAWARDRGNSTVPCVEFIFRMKSSSTQYDDIVFV